MSQDDFKGQTDHDLLIVAVTELRHIKNHVKDLAAETKAQNGRLSALEHWRVGLTVILGFISVLWPLLIYEVRQFMLERFGFVG